MSKRMYDAAFAPTSPPPWEVVGGYIGGNAYHVWSEAEWASQPARYRLPIYVRSHPAGHDPHDDAAAAITWLRHHGVPRGCAVALDLETAVNGPYVRAFDQALVAAGYVVLAYGSLDTIFGNPRTSGGYWVAHYTGYDHMEPRAVATQWANDKQLGKPWDANTVADSVPLWDTQQAQEDDMAQVSSLGAGGTLSIAAGAHADFKWTKEFTDKHGLHGDNGASVVIAKEAFWCIADAIFKLTGLPAGARFDIAWTRVKDNGAFIDDAWRKTFTADQSGTLRDELGGQFSVNADNRLRLRLYNTGTAPLAMTIVQAEAGQPVTMAKATLLKY